MEVNGQLYTPTSLPPKERAPCIRWIGGWVGPRTGLDAVPMREMSLHFPTRESNPDRALHNLINTLTELPPTS